MLSAKDAAVALTGARRRSPGRLRPWLAPQDRRGLAAVALWSAVLAVCTGAYGLLVGPVLRALFGGTRLTWPAAWADVLPPAPSVESLRVALPGVVVGVAALKGWAAHRHAVRSARLGLGLVQRVQAAVHARVLALPPDVAHTMGVGEVVGRMVHDAAAVQQLLVAGYLRRARDAAQIVVLVGVCLVLDWRMALAGLAVYPVIFWPLDRLRRRLKRAARAGLAGRGALTGRMTEDLARLPQLQLAGDQGAARRRVSADIEAVASAHLDAARLASLASPLTELAGAVALGLTLWWASQRIAAGVVAAEHVMGFFVSLLLVYEPAKGLARAQAVIEPGRMALARIDELLMHPARLPTGDVGLAPPSQPVPIHLRGVRVHRGGRQVLSIDALDLPAGGLVAVVGPNGAGKSTLAWLLGGLLTAWEGEVRVGEAALGALAPDPWRRRVGWLLGAPSLPRGSVQAAIVDGRALDAARLQHAIEDAGLTSVWQRLGADGALGDAGAGLSSGERQRVALARALYGAPWLLVLDEPEAHLDREGRAALGARLRALVDAGRTVLLLTHDAELARAADLTVHLIDGRLA